ncbi:MAG: hypothetical protein JST89_05540 [Cyanobacteria bacterium SZAS-4]|nr:hypothetical protein [Cyanobacteria bacterium SZAS-4]
MTTNFQKLDSFTNTEKSTAYEKLPSAKDSMNTQISELRDSDPKGYLSNINQMVKMGLDPKACPKLELLDDSAMLEKKQTLLKNPKGAEDFEGEPKEPKKFSDADGGLKDGKGALQDFNVKDLEIKIGLSVEAQLKKDSEVKLPNYSVQHYEG